MAMHTIKTDISVIEMSKFQMFLDASELTQTVIMGYHSVRMGTFQTDNFISYSFSDKEDNTTLSFFKLKYGGLEKAFKDYLRVEGKIKDMMAGGYGIDSYTV